MALQTSQLRIFQVARSINDEPHSGIDPSCVAGPKRLQVQAPFMCPAEPVGIFSLAIWIFTSIGNEVTTRRITLAGKVNRQRDVLRTIAGACARKRVFAVAPKPSPIGRRRAKLLHAIMRLYGISQSTYVGRHGPLIAPGLAAARHWAACRFATYLRAASLAPQRCQSSAPMPRK